MRAEGGEAPWRSSNVEAGSDGGRRSSRGDWYAQEYSRYASDRREWEPRSPLRPRRRSSRSLSPRRPSLARSDPPLLVPSRLPQQYLNAQDSLSRPLHPPSSLDVDKDRLSTLNLSAADLRTIETLWDPLARPPYPSFSRTTSVSTIFGYLSPSDAVDALKLPPPSFVADDPARKERYEGWLRSQTGDKGRYLAMMGQLMCFSRCQEEFGRMAKEDAEAVVLAHRD
ncbi:hypothetical protein BCR35DRAFT_300083 [Leucosporidium creatinivorum]|uniref:Uncharacterized protein n=1 Tax=Leucosporidium creatinivorum TaxID=106004 RepID=A0A1Y2G122_9BASI|nr:hypothetical protein BCR35DRAFT_300083 [Leucosporidium creatinivorum]